jgi:hypothetical protein
MKLWMSAEIDADLYEAYVGVRRVVQDRVNALLAATDYGGGLEEWDVLPMITTAEAPGYNEIARLSKDGRSAEFRLRIPHAEFSRATAKERSELLIGLLIRSVRSMPSIGLPDMDLDRLCQDLERLSKELLQ